MHGNYDSNVWFVTYFEEFYILYKQYAVIGHSGFVQALVRASRQCGCPWGLATHFTPLVTTVTWHR
jgi:hypothetical protein